MMPSRGCLKSRSDPALWHMCLLYLAFFSVTYIFVVRLAEVENATEIDTVFEKVVLAGPRPDNLTLSEDIVLERKSEVDDVKPPDEVAPPPSDPKRDNVSEGHDDIPSFSEWAKKQMAEVGKNKGENLTVSTMKLRLKNYASPDCGAKVVASNPEAVSPGAILSPSRDDYMLSPCNVKIWFVVELCEAIQPQRVEIANFELFSSSPQDLSIWVSDRFPTREWSLVASVQAKDERTVQSFPLPQLTHFAKYVKLELHSHYGTEHYCPISLFKAYGTSELEVLDSADDDQSSEASTSDDDDEPALQVEATPTLDDKTGPKLEENLFGTAKAAVLSIVKKAAEVLVVKGGERNNSCPNTTSTGHCLTPSYNVVCNNCSEQFYYRLFDAVCCQSRKIKELISSPFVSTVISQSPLCNDFGIDFTNSSESNSSDGTHALGMSYLSAFLQRDTLAALCNYLAITKRKTSLNVSHDKNKSESVPPTETFAPSPSTVGPEPDEPTLTESETVLWISPTKTTSEDNSTAHESVQPVTDRLEVNSTSEESTENLAEPTPPLEPETLPEPSEPLVESEEKPEPGPEPVVLVGSDESVTVDSLALDSLFPEIEEETGQELESSATKTLNSPPVQKESVFVRLANRIKSLEVNMSLSSQYLEELSRRYKKQVEELQRTLASIVEERRLAAERESIQAAQIMHLTSKNEALTAAVTQLLDERSSWTSKAYQGVIIAIEVILLFLIIGICRWLTAPGKIIEIPPKPVPPPNPIRRHSVDEIDCPPKTRRPSEEALIPSSATHQELLIQGVRRKTSKESRHKRKRRRKDWRTEGRLGGDDVPIDWPEYIKTAEWTRRQRSQQTQTSSNETITSHSTAVTINSSVKKKAGAFKKIVKKLF